MNIALAKSEITFRVLHRIAQDSLESLQIDNLPIQYQSLHQDYLNEYHAKDGHQKRVRFLEIAVGSRLVGFACIVSVLVRDQGLGSTTQRLELNQIVFDVRISSALRVEAIRKGADFLLTRKSEWTSEPSIGVSQKMSDPFMPLLVKQAGFVATAVSAEMRIDLTKGEAPLFASLRKKHRQQIRKYCDLTRVSVRPNVDALEEMQQLHFQVSGRITRSPLTWKIQEQAITENLAFVVTIRSLSDEFLGALYVMYSDYDAVSFSAAYNHSAVEKGYPLGHLCEWEAIKFLGSNSSAQSYLIGGASRETVNNSKLSSINLFKDGFSPTYHLIGHLDYIN